MAIIRRERPARQIIVVSRIYSGGPLGELHFVCLLEALVVDAYESLQLSRLWNAHSVARTRVSS